MTQHTVSRRWALVSLLMSTMPASAFWLQPVRDNLLSNAAYDNASPRINLDGSVRPHVSGSTLQKRSNVTLWTLDDVYQGKTFFE